MTGKTHERVKRTLCSPHVKHSDVLNKERFWVTISAGSMRVRVKIKTHTSKASHYTRVACVGFYTRIHQYKRNMGNGGVALYIICMCVGVQYTKQWLIGACLGSFVVGWRLSCARKRTTQSRFVRGSGDDDDDDDGDCDQGMSDGREGHKKEQQAIRRPDRLYGCVKGCWKKKLFLFYLVYFVYSVGPGRVVLCRRCFALIYFAPAVTYLNYTTPSALSLKTGTDP